MYKILTVFLITAALFILPGCIEMPEEFIMPQWDVDLNVPIAQKRYILDEIIKSKGTLVSLNPIDNLYYFKSEDYGQAVGIGELITLKTSSSTNGNIVPLNQSSDIYLAFPEGAKLKTAVFNSGKIRLVGKNPSNGPVSLNITVPGIVKNNQILSIQLDIPANTVNNPVIVERDLQGWNYAEPSNQVFLFRGQIWFQVSATAALGAGIGSTFDISSSDFEFNSVTGYFPRRTLSSRRNAFDLKIGEDASDFRDRIKLQEATLKLKGKYLSTSGTPFKILVDNFKVIGKRKNGQQIVLTGQSQWSFDNSNNVELNYNQTNSNILEFIQFIPDSVVILGDYILNPDNDPSNRTVNSTDSVSFYANFETKSILAIQKAYITSTEEMDFEQEDRDQILDAQSASLTYEIESKLPLNVWVKVMLLDRTKNKLFAVTGRTGNNLDSLQINSAYNNNGISKGTITLDSTDFLKLSKAYFAEVSVTVETANYPQPYSIKSTDWIKINTFGSVKYRLKEKEDN